jgi:hypothetical protein
MPDTPAGSRNPQVAFVVVLGGIIAIGWLFSGRGNESNQSAVETPRAATEPAQPKPEREPPEKPSPHLPGLTSGGLTTTFEKEGLSCRGPEQQRTMAAWHCEGRDSSGAQLKIEFMGRPTRIEYLTATVMQYQPEIDRAVLARFLGYVATVPYDGADPAQARRWVQQNIRREFAETQIGPALLRISGPERGRSISVMMPGSPWAS